MPKIYLVPSVEQFFTLFDNWPKYIVGTNDQSTNEKRKISRTGKYGSAVSVTQNRIFVISLSQIWMSQILLSQYSKAALCGNLCLIGDVLDRLTQFCSEPNHSLPDPRFVRPRIICRISIVDSYNFLEILRAALGNGIIVVQQLRSFSASCAICGWQTVAGRKVHTP